MEHRTVTAVLDAPRERVFAYLSQIENLPKWRPSSPVSSSTRMAEPRS